MANAVMVARGNFLRYSTAAEATWPGVAPTSTNWEAAVPIRLPSARVNLPGSTPVASHNALKMS